MPETPLITRIYAQVSCVDGRVSERWFSALFARPPDAKPMAGLYEWTQGDHGGLQLFENSKDAGHGTLTIIVSDIRAEHARLHAAGLAPGPLEPATTTRLVRLNDPDGNLIVLAQPHDV